MSDMYEDNKDMWNTRLRLYLEQCSVKKIKPKKDEFARRYGLNINTVKTWFHRHRELTEIWVSTGFDLKDKIFANLVKMCEHIETEKGMMRPNEKVILEMAKQFGIIEDKDSDDVQIEVTFQDENGGITKTTTTTTKSTPKTNDTESLYGDNDWGEED